MEILAGINNCTIINDSYNSDLNSILIAIDVLNRQHQHKKKSIIISDIVQKEQNKEELYEKLSKILNKAKLNHIILVGNELYKNQKLIKGNTFTFKNIEELILSSVLNKFKDEAILIKADRKFEFQKLSEILQQKSNSTVLEISMKALTHNLNYFKSLLKPETKIMVMVKAFSYGSGTHEIANWLKYQQIDYLGVALTYEGVELRKAGVSLPIMVMNPSFESYNDIINYKLEPELYNFSSLKKFSEFVEKKDINQYSVHIKLDTGMKRLGFVKNDIHKLQNELKQIKNLKVQSVFSHLAATDDGFHDDFTNQQISDYKNLTLQIKKVLPYNFISHIVNSSGIERFSNAHFDMVRLGIGLYGISPTYQDKLRHISTLKTTISQIKTVNPNETVGYSRKGTILKKTKIAILPIGYADGFNRKFSNGIGRVYINGKFAPIIGNICMDLCMVDLTGIEANENDEVIIFGEQIPISKLAELIETIAYEILTGISQRVKRVYIH